MLRTGFLKADYVHVYKKCKMKPLHYFLVFVQFAGIFFFVLSGKVTPENAYVTVFEIFSVVLALWAYLVMKKHTFTVMPGVRENAQLCTTGPYRIIRHPMYTSVLILLLALLVNEFSILRAIVFAVVLVDLIFKISVEEKILRHKYAEYSDYEKNTWKIIPLIF